MASSCMQVPYSGFGIWSRITATIALSRCIRIACFTSTVLPSPQPGCYLRRFPRLVPDTAWGLIKAGYTTMRGEGGVYTATRLYVQPLLRTHHPRPLPI